jgi:hypothetical protein
MVVPDRARPALREQPGASYEADLHFYAGAPLHLMPSSMRWSCQYILRRATPRSLTRREVALLGIDG